MTVTRRTTVVSAAALSALLALAACNGADPVVGPTGSSSSTSSTTTTAPPTTTSKATTTTPTPTVDPVLAKIPKAARPETMEGAGAYMEFYFKELNKAFQTLDTSTLDLLSAKGCLTCTALSDGVKSIKGKGQHYGGDLIRVKYATASEFTPEVRRVLIDLSQQSVPVLTNSNQTVGKTPAGKAQFVATLEFKGRWLISRLQKVAS